MKKTRKQILEHHAECKEYSDKGWEVGLRLIASLDDDEDSELKRLDLNEALAKIPVVDAVKEWIAKFEPELLEDVPDEFESDFLDGFIQTLHERLD